MFLGRNAVMRKALGATPEDECRLGVHKAANVSRRPVCVTRLMQHVWRPLQSRPRSCCVQVRHDD
jgi:hypothetical protein